MWVYTSFIFHIRLKARWSTCSGRKGKNKNYYSADGHYKISSIDLVNVLSEISIKLYRLWDINGFELWHIYWDVMKQGS